MKVVLVGGSGFLGRAVRKRLVERGDEAVVVGRGSSQTHSGWRSVRWDAASLGPWTTEFESADAVVHLAGKRVDCRPTTKNIDELIRSRESSVRLVGEAIQSLETPPPVWVQLSSLAIFGDSGDRIIDESTPPAIEGPRQMVENCRRWEAAFDEATTGVDRTVLLRPGICIGGPGDPATERLVQLSKFGLGGAIPPGTQWVSWIGFDDFINVLMRAIDDPTMSGTYHVTAPNPVPNSEMMAAYRAAVGRSFGLRSPSPIVTLGAWLLGSDPGLGVSGRRCVPARLLAEGYEFTTTEIEQAVADAVELMNSGKA